MNFELNEIPGATPDFRTELAEKLADLVPEAVAEGKIDTKKLEELLDGDAADTRERFGLFWPGKKRALRAAQESTTATLVPDKENSRDWDTTQNVFIEGDNLEVLKILQKHYHAKIKMIYIDPPYNTGKDFVYPDNYQEGLKSYLEFTQQVDEGGKKLSTNSDQAGRYHSNWLNMMYPRLKLARNLLKSDGAVFISIDDSELENLKRLTHEVFGENNFVGTMIWAAGRKNDSKYISVSHEYVLCYARNIEFIKEHQITWKVRKKGLDAIYKVADKFTKEADGDYAAASQKLKAWYAGLPDGDDAKRNKHYWRIDKRGVYFAGDISWPGGGGPEYDVWHPVTGKPVRIPSRGWLFQSDKMQQHIADGRVLFGDNETNVPTFKRYLAETEYEAPYSVFYQDGRAATKRLRTLFGRKVFDFPKDEFVLQSLIEMVTQNDDLILDFFAGSATIAHAAMEVNARDGGNRRHIQVQLPEPVQDKDEAYKAGFRTIAEIGRKRIELAADKIKEDYSGKLTGRKTPLDTGFRAFKLSDTNFSKWRLTSDVAETELEQHLLSLRESADDQASQEALLTELLLKRGYSLTEQVDVFEVAGLEIHGVKDAEGDYGLLAYLNEHQKPSLEQLRMLVDRAEAQIVILEDAFQGDDQLKTNLAQLCKSKGTELWTA